MKTLFRFAQAKRYFPKDINAMEGIENEFEDDSEIEIFTPEELRRLFASARAELIPYLAIAAFAGLRAAELVRLDWSDVKADYIELKKGKAKTRSRRLIPIQPNLAAWLAHYRQKSGPVTQFANMSKQLLWLAENTAAEGKEDGTPAKPALTWKHNGLRHSFITYRMAIANDENIVASESGNSPDMIYRHYRQLITPEQAKAWFSIVPTPAPA
ncbi:MAG: hypothetical protein DME24_01085 [Verrucomicrobia bacterium]|nr:MAG: hypothetical protein DME24_01085 [Verrucomicrobiota bacterium]